MRGERMAVANGTIIEKMMIELKKALEKQDHHVDMVKHISNVQLLCDLILEENELTNKKRKKQVGHDQNKSEHREQKTLTDSTTNPNKKMKSSILDF